jgi:restriction endonuclease
LDKAQDKEELEVSALSKSDKLNISLGESINSRYEALEPHSFQRDIYLQVKKNWAKNTPLSQQQKEFGHIVYLETGTGKTYIAIMLLKLIFADESGLE